MLLELSAISKEFSDGKDSKVRPLKSLDLTVNSGDMIAIIGTSGTGKSTLLNIIGCIDKQTDGKYCVEGLDVNTYGDKQLSRLRNETFGYIMQDFSLIAYRSALDNVILPLLLRRKMCKNASELGLNALEITGVAELAHKKAWELSGGEKQRVAIARAIVNNPKVILADEPTGSLDIENRDKIYNILADLNKQGKTIICVTHDMEIANKFDTIYRLDNGSLIKCK